MKVGTAFALGLGLYSVYYLSQIGVATETIQVNFTNVRILSLTRYIITMTVQNISNVTVTVKSMTGNILVNGNQLASMSDFTPTEVPANGQVNIDIEVDPSLLSLPGTIADMINSSNGSLLFTAVGNANVNGLVLPFTLDKEIAL